MVIMRTPLQGKATGNVSTIKLYERQGLDFYDLRVQPNSASFEIIQSRLGIVLPDRIGSTTTNDGNVHALGLGPDAWLIVNGKEEYKKMIDFEKGDHHISIVDVSGQRTTIEIQGPHARNVLSHLWEQDLRDKSFPIGSVSQGLMAKAPVILWHYGSLHYRVMVRSSFAVHVWEVLEDAMVEWV